MELFVSGTSYEYTHNNIIDGMTKKCPGQHGTTTSILAVCTQRVKNNKT